MKRSRFSEEQIIGILKEHQAGASQATMCASYERESAAQDHSLRRRRPSFT